jgi:hypothetical protein
MTAYATCVSFAEDRPQEGLSSEKREDIWALLIALVVLLFCLAAPEAVYDFFRRALYVF